MNRRGTAAAGKRDRSLNRVDAKEKQKCELDDDDGAYDDDDVADDDGDDGDDGEVSESTLDESFRGSMAGSVSNDALDWKPEGAVIHRDLSFINTYR